MLKYKYASLSRDADFVCIYYRASYFSSVMQLDVPLTNYIVSVKTAENLKTPENECLLLHELSAITKKSTLFKSQSVTDKHTKDPGVKKTEIKSLSCNKTKEK